MQKTSVSIEVQEIDNLSKSIEYKSTHQQPKRRYTIDSSYRKSVSVSQTSSNNLNLHRPSRVPPRFSFIGVINEDSDSNDDDAVQVNHTNSINTITVQDQSVDIDTSELYNANGTNCSKESIIKSSKNTIDKRESIKDQTYDCVTK
jgi:hypothetical protein